MSGSLSPAARVIGPVTSAALRPLLARGFAPRRRLLDVVGVLIGQRAAGTAVRATVLGGVPVEVVTPQRPSASVTIVYLHGGAYVSMSPRSHRRLVSHLAAATGCRVIAVDYRLAPEHPYPAALDDATAAYTAHLAEAPQQKVVLAGDSAGGGLALATAIALRDRGQPLPAALVLIAPWVDLTCSGDSMRSRTRRERVLTPAALPDDARRYAGDLDVHSPLVSPLFADLEGLPPMLIQVGDDEVLLDDSLRLAQRAQDAGVPVNLQVWQRLWHVWQLYAGLLPEAADAVGAIAEFVREQTGDS